MPLWSGRTRPIWRLIGVEGEAWASRLLGRDKPWPFAFAVLIAAICLIAMQVSYSYVDLGLTSGRDLLLFGLALAIMVVIGGMGSILGSIVGGLARKATRSMLLLVVVVAGIWLLGKVVPGGFIPDEDKGFLFVAVELPEGHASRRRHASSALHARVEQRQVAGQPQGRQLESQHAPRRILAGRSDSELVRKRCPSSCTS